MLLLYPTGTSMTPSYEKDLHSRPFKHDLTLLFENFNANFHVASQKPC